MEADKIRILVPLSLAHRRLKTRQYYRPRAQCREEKFSKSASRHAMTAA
jgi:hypothetical protein